MNDDLLDRYLADKATPEERVEAEAWLKDRPVMGFVAEELVGNEKVVFDVDKAWKTIDVKSYKKANTSFRYLWAPATAIIAFFAIKYIPSTTSSETKNYITSTGQRASFNLADGTHVILAPSSKLTVTGRNAELSGEAVFTVTQHDDHPFSVKAGKTVTRVLGTTFGVRSYNDKIRVFVTEGRVAFTGEASMVLGTGDVATVTNSSTVLQHNVDTSDIAAWTSGRLAFSNTPITDAIQDIERWYGVKIILSKSLNTQRVTASLDEVPLSEVLQILTMSIDARYVQSGNQITIYPRER